MPKLKNLEYLLALHAISGVGSKTLFKLMDHFEDPKLIWEASPMKFKELGIYPSVISKIEKGRQSLNPKEVSQRIESKGIGVITIYDKNYPKLLKEIYDPPIILYFKGNASILNKRAIGVVGTRKITGYGRVITEEFAGGLARSGLVVVSGLAKGVDTLAHRATLSTGGETVAVLGGGINNIFPPENQGLAKEIWEKNGVIISEFPPAYPNLSGNFPARNRIIAGLSLGILVTEAASDSGSLITAREAIEQGREVFAVPGPINSYLSEGPAKLIKNGAKLVTNYKDILEDLNLEYLEETGDKKITQISMNEQAIIDYLSSGVKHLDEICRDLKRKTPEVSATLIKMEIQGLVKNLGGGNFAAL